MGKVTIALGENVDLIIDEPDATASTNRAVVIASAISQEFSDNYLISPSIRDGSIPLTIGGKFYRIYYELRVKRILDSLTVYSNAIEHIKSNINIYDYRLANVAIETLRKCFRDKSK